MTRLPVSEIALGRGDVVIEPHESRFYVKQVTTSRGGFYVFHVWGVRGTHDEAERLALLVLNGEHQQGRSIEGGQPLEQLMQAERAVADAQKFMRRFKRAVVMSPDVMAGNGITSDDLYAYATETKVQCEYAASRMALVLAELVKARRATEPRCAHRRGFIAEDPLTGEGVCPFCNVTESMAARAAEDEDDDG